MTNVLLGVGGGIAAYKVAWLASRLVQQGVDVRVAMTADAQRFVGAVTFEGLTGKKAILSAKPSLLEPVVELEVTIPSRFMGDISGDLNSRRGRIVGMDTEGDMQIIKASVPLAEVSSYSTELKSITGGEGSYTVEFSHYDIVPANIAQQIAAKAARENQD